MDNSDGTNFKEDPLEIAALISFCRQAMKEPQIMELEANKICTGFLARRQLTPQKCLEEIDAIRHSAQDVDPQKLQNARIDTRMAELRYHCMRQEVLRTGNLPAALRNRVLLRSIQCRMYFSRLEILGKQLFKIARLEEALKVYMKIEAEALDIGGDDDPMADKVTVILIKLGRWQDLWAYISFWCKRQRPPDPHGPAAAGDFPYQTDEHVNDPTVDHFAVLEPRKNFQTLYFLTALFIMKTNLCESRLGFAKQMNIFGNTDRGRLLNEVSSVMAEMAAGDEAFRLLERNRLGSLLDAIDRCNPSLLPAFVYPDPLYNECFFDMDEDDQQLPWFPRCPVEAYYVHKAFRNELQKYPLARRLLVERLGSERPEYHWGEFDEPAPM